MLTYRAVTRNIQIKILNSPAIFKCTSQTYCSSSDSDNGKRKKEPKDEKKGQSNEALSKLNVLLKKMIQEDPQVSKAPGLNLAKPKPRNRQNKAEHGTISTKIESVDQKIVSAAKNVAESLGGNVKQTESELLSKLLSPSTNNQDPTNKSPNLSDILSGMKIDRTVNKPDEFSEVSRASQVRKMIDRSSGKPPEGNVGRQSVSKSMRRPRIPKGDRQATDLFGAEPLGIFTPKESEEVTKIADPQKEVVLKTWNLLQERELRLAVTHPPNNYFQEMMFWTEQGKVWKFPIDNEQGMEEEQNIYFAEHIFLEKHLEPWCPTKGPIRHFMELVCVGLSKNPYLTVEVKKDHIFWYKDYFLSKKQLLEEIGAMPANPSKPQEITER